MQLAKKTIITPTTEALFDLDAPTVEDVILRNAYTKKLTSVPLSGSSTGTDSASSPTAFPNITIGSVTDLESWNRGVYDELHFVVHVNTLKLNYNTGWKSAPTFYIYVKRNNTQYNICNFTVNRNTAITSANKHILNNLTFVRKLNKLQPVNLNYCYELDFLSGDTATWKSRVGDYASFSSQLNSNNENSLIPGDTSIQVVLTPGEVFGNAAMIYGEIDGTLDIYGRRILGGGYSDLSNFEYPSRHYYS